MTVGCTLLYIILLKLVTFNSIRMEKGYGNNRTDSNCTDISPEIAGFI